MTWETILQSLLVAHDYNTFGSYGDFYRSYQKRPDHQPLVDFVFGYQPAITIESMSCVALSLYLLKRLQAADRMHGGLFSLVSCEEMVTVEANGSKGDSSYQMESKNNVKEHVMVCLKFSLVDTGRSGYVLMDPGYHVARPVVVMNNCGGGGDNGGSYPHTGWFVASINAKSTKEYAYQAVGDQFVLWKVRETSRTTGALLKEYVNIVYVKKEFTKYAVTEKRALIFSMKSYVVRSKKRPIAGFYSWIDDPARLVTVFYEDETTEGRVTKKFSIDEIAKIETGGGGEAKRALTRVAELMVAQKSEASASTSAATAEGALEDNSDGDQAITTVEKQVSRFLEMLTAYRESIYDADFCPELCEIDKWIDEE